MTQADNGRHAKSYQLPVIAMSTVVEWRNTNLMID